MDSEVLVSIASLFLFGLAGIKFLRFCLRGLFSLLRLGALAALAFGAAHLTLASSDFSALPSERTGHIVSALAKDALQRWKGLPRVEIQLVWPEGARAANTGSDDFAHSTAIISQSRYF